MFSHQKIVAYLVTWSLDIISKVPNGLYNTDNQIDNISLDFSSKLNVNYIIFHVFLPQEGGISCHMDVGH